MAEADMVVVVIIKALVPRDKLADVIVDPNAFRNFGLLVDAVGIIGRSCFCSRGVRSGVVR